MNKVFSVIGAGLMLAGLGGCIIAPAEPAPAYGYYSPGYYAPGYAVYPPPVSVGLGFRFGDGFHHWR